MSIFNLAVSQDAEGNKALDLNVYGVIGGGWFDEEAVSAAEVAALLQEHRDAKAITVHINSEGGSLFDGLAIYNLLQGHGGQITAKVEGIAASAASLIAMAGRTVMARGAMIMIHNPAAMVAGDAPTLRQMAAILDKAQAGLIAVYKAKTGKDAAELRALLNAETWMDAEQAKRNGFADEIADDTPAVEDMGETVIVNAVQFPHASMPVQILNLSRPPRTVEDPPAVTEPPAPVEPPPVVENAAPVLTPAITAESIPAEIRQHIFEDGWARGVADERARIQAIDALKIHGCDDLVTAAKYVEPTDSASLAVAVLKSEERARATMLARRCEESAALAGVRPNSPDQTDRATEEVRVAKQIAAFANAGRGETR